MQMIDALKIDDKQGLQSKKNEHEIAAELCAENSYFTSAVSRIYYAFLFDLCLIVCKLNPRLRLAAISKIEADLAKQGRQWQHASHRFIENICQEMISDRAKKRMFSDKFQSIKELRVKADYETVSIGQLDYERVLVYIKRAKSYL